MTESNNEDIVEEDILVYADFDSVLDERMFQNEALFKMISLDSEEPFLQIGTQVYSGKWADTVGTHLFFEPEESPPPSDPVFSDVPRETLKFKFKTRKSLELSRVFINKKEAEDGEECIDEDSVEEFEEHTQKDPSDKECETKEGNEVNTSTDDKTSTCPSNEKSTA